MENLKISFLGGVGEIGKNMTVYEYGKDMIVVDSGLAFPNDEMPGIDLVVQDISYLLNTKCKIRGIFITHGHEDHIGSLPYVLDQIKAPVYGSKLTMGLIENKLREFKNITLNGNVVKGGSTIIAGAFKVEFVNVTHSIPGAMALVITTPAGVVVHSGDFKIDFTPVAGQVCDLKRLAEVGKNGVTLLMCESTNVEREGFSLSEAVVAKTFDDLFAKYADKRLFIATFASNIHRLQHILDLSAKYNRKVAFSGRSMVNVSEMAMKVGELKCNKNILIDIDKIDKFSDKELTIITTGSQGEAMSALSRMASDSFPKVFLGSNDAVIISAAPIPGNEKAINNIINELYRRDCIVVYNELADVHASGHANREEIKILHSLIRPKFFIPIHGEYRHLKRHQLLAQELGMKERNIIIPEIGTQVELNKGMIKKVQDIPAGELLVDGTGLGDKESVVLRDRKVISQEGICVVVIGINSLSYQVIEEPEIISRGFIYQDEASELISEGRKVIFEALGKIDLKGMEQQDIKNFIKKTAQSFFFKKTKRRPMIISVLNYK